jgi:hypothetical protein
MPTHQGASKIDYEIADQTSRRTETDYTPVFTRRQARATGDLDSYRSGLSGDDLQVLLQRVPDEVMILRPARDDSR